MGCVGIILYCTVLYYIILLQYCTVMLRVSVGCGGIVLYCTILYYIIL